MTIVPPVETPAFPISPAPQESITPASQNLFEHSALNTTTLPQGASPADLGRTIIDNLEGFVERAGKFAASAVSSTVPGQPPVTASFTPGGLPAEASAVRTPDSDAERLVESLGRIFDHAIETQMVVRAPTQFTSATMTLTKGQ